MWEEERVTGEPNGGWIQAEEDRGDEVDDGRAFSGVSCSAWPKIGKGSERTKEQGRFPLVEASRVSCGVAKGNNGSAWTNVNYRHTALNNNHHREEREAGARTVGRRSNGYINLMAWRVMPTLSYIEIR